MFHRSLIVCETEQWARRHWRAERPGCLTWTGVIAMDEARRVLGRGMAEQETESGSSVCVTGLKEVKPVQQHSGSRWSVCHRKSPCVPPAAATHNRKTTSFQNTLAL